MVGRVVEEQIVMRKGKISLSGEIEFSSSTRLSLSFSIRIGNLFRSGSAWVPRRGKFWYIRYLARTFAPGVTNSRSQYNSNPYCSILMS